MIHWGTYFIKNYYLIRRIERVKHKTEQDDLIIRYFFSQLPEEQEQEVEERFLTDSEFFEQMLSVEDALIDAYAQGILSTEERRKVEKFLLPRHRRTREVDFVKDLLSDLAKVQPAHDANSILEAHPSRWRSFLTFFGLEHLGKRFSFAFLLLVTLSLALAIWNLILQNKVTQIESKQAAVENEDQILRQQLTTQIEKNQALEQEVANERNKSEQLQQELALLRGPDASAQPNDTATIFLTADSFLRSGGELKLVRISRGVNQLEINLEVNEEDRFVSYIAVLKSFDGREIWSKYDIKPNKTKPGQVSLTLSAKILTNEDYTLSLKGQRDNKDIQDIGDYSFRVKK